MRYKTFRALVATGCGTVLIGGAAAGVVAIGHRPRPAPRTRPLAMAHDASTPVVVAQGGAAVAGEQPLRTWDVQILTRIRENNMAGDKAKDVLHGSPWKVNLYRDSGHVTANRVKIDLDRDGKNDEKWSIDGDRIQREVAPADDEQYTQTFLLENGRWIPKGSSAAESAPATPAPVAVVTSATVPVGADEVPLRAMDRQILDRVAQNISGAKAKDAIPRQPWKVDLYRDPGQTKVNRLKIDLDRDNHWDEKWSFEGDEVKREISPDDDERYTVEYRLLHGEWVKKK